MRYQIEVASLIRDLISHNEIIANRSLFDDALQRNIFNVLVQGIHLNPSKSPSANMLLEELKKMKNPLDSIEKIPTEPN